MIYQLRSSVLTPLCASCHLSKSEHLCGYCWSTRRGASVQVLCGWPVDPRPSWGQQLFSHSKCDLLSAKLSDPLTMELEKLSDVSPQPVITSQMGTVNNIIQVKKTDFEVFDALMVDSQKCSDMSGECWHLPFMSALLDSVMCITLCAGSRKVC